MSRRRPVVAIDGPAGAGKTTVTRRVAESLGYLLVGTGSMYRCVALAAKRRGVSWDEEESVGAIARELAAAQAIGFRHDPAGQQVVLNGEDVTQALRAEDIGQGASKVSALPAVREALLEMQRAVGAAGGVVLEGRDIGTVVFPEAEAKFFLTASLDVRARRRYDELVERGAEVGLDDVLRDVEERDRRDTMRPVAPLVRADDALLIDSSALGIDDVVGQIVERVREVERELAEAR